MSTDLKISQLTTETAIQDADVLPVVDVADGITKKTTWANIKSLLQTYFVTLFVDFATIQILTNKVLGTGTKITLGSDATGDTYYRDSSGNLVRLGIGSTGQVVTVAGGLPSYVTPATVATGSYSTPGVLQGLTDAATSGLTIAAGVVSVNSGVGANQIVKLNGSSQIPAVDGSLLTGVTRLITQSGTAVTSSVANTSVNALITQSVSGGLLGTTGAIRFRGFGTWNGNNSTRTLAFIVAYGSTTILTTTFTDNGGNTTVNFEFDFMLYASGATNSQKSNGYIRGRASNTTLATTALVSMNSAVSGTASEDSTVTKNLVLSTQINIADASAASITISNYTIEVLK